LPQDVVARLRALDSAITPELAEASWALLTPFHEKLGYAAPRIVRDLRYGEHARHRLDVHAPVATGTAEPSGGGADDHGAPVFVFVHGGGFVRGDKPRCRRGGARRPTRPLRRTAHRIIRIREIS
jgi:acetyl esterase/lipase